MKRDATPQRALMELPRCTQGRVMVLRPTNKQTAEQLFCGVWYDCEHCKESVLYPSQELQSQLSAHQPSAPSRTGRSCNFSKVAA